MAPPPDISPRAREIVVVARELLEREGPDALSMRRIAAQLGIRAPSLYEHVPDKRALENALISEGLIEQGDAMLAAMRDAEDPIGEIAAAFRAFALAHPHLYRLITDRALDQEGLIEGAERHAGSALLQAVGGDRDLALALWAFAHGMITLELNGRFPDYGDIDEVWRRGLRAVRAGAERQRANETER